MPNTEGLKSKMENNIMYVRSDIRNWGGFCKIKNILSASSCTVKEMWLLTESSEFSQSVQTPPLLVIPRKQIRTTDCCNSPGLTTKSLLKNRKEKASLGNRIFVGIMTEILMLVEGTKTRDQQTFPQDRREQNPHLRSPSCWAITRTEQCIQARWIPSQSFACKNTHFEYDRSQSCLPGALGGTHSASGCSLLTWGSSLLISGHGLMDCSLQKPKLQLTEAQQGPCPGEKKRYPLPNKAEAAAETGKSLREKPTLLSSSRVLQCRLLKWTWSQPFRLHSGWSLS